MRVKGRVALVAGEDWQLGRVLGRSVSEGGVSKVYAAVHNAGDLDPPADIPVHLDVSDLRSAQTAAAQGPDVAILINNASSEAATSTPLHGIPSSLARQ